MIIEGFDGLWFRQIDSHELLMRYGSPCINYKRLEKELGKKDLDLLRNYNVNGPQLSKEILQVTFKRFMRKFPELTGEPVEKIWEDPMLIRKYFLLYHNQDLIEEHNQNNHEIKNVQYCFSHVREYTNRQTVSKKEFISAKIADFQTNENKLFWNKYKEQLADTTFIITHAGTVVEPTYKK